MSEQKKRKRDTGNEQQEKSSSSSSTAQGKTERKTVRAKRSSVWRHFTQVERHKVQCHACERRFAYHSSTSGMSAHLKVCSQKSENQTKKTDVKQLTLPSLVESGEQRKDDITLAFVMNGIAYQVGCYEFQNFCLQDTQNFWNSC